jgi:mono/diheme cytochrome c family protein
VGENILKEEIAMKRVINLVAFALGVAVIGGLLLPSQAVMADQKDPYAEKGRKLFMQYCASCHGVDAKGQGPVAAALKGGPPDLTMIQVPGQKFPFNRVNTVVDGERDVPAHGTRKMPVWGTIFRRTRGELQKHADIYSLVKYVESIQEAGK